jgi:hypothetical protein
MRTGVGATPWLHVVCSIPLAHSPLGHTEQYAPPIATFWLNLPDGHGKHENWPGWLTYWPASSGTHVGALRSQHGLEVLRHRRRLSRQIAQRQSHLKGIRGSRPARPHPGTCPPGIPCTSSHRCLQPLQTKCQIGPRRTGCTRARCPRPSPRVHRGSLCSTSPHRPGSGTFHQGNRRSRSRE